jgi:methionyl-tRNA formyltransferase
LLKFPEIDCQLVVSQSDKIIGRKKELSFTPVKNIAKNHNLNVLQPEKIKNNQDFFEVLRKIKPDFIVVAAYGKIIPKQILDIPQYGCINIHGSILPKFR